MRRAIAIMLLWLIAACGVPEQDTGPDPLLFDALAMSQADSVVIGIPGALTSIRVLAPLQDALSPTRAVAYYRLPGYDGRPEAEWVDITRAANRISYLVSDYGLQRIDLVGHSTGAVIAMEAAKQIRRTSPKTQVHVHAISTALPAPQPLLAGVRGAAGTVTAALRARSVKPHTVWMDYYRTLAYGAEVEADPEAAQAADALAQANGDRIVLPTKGLGRRHTRALRRWTNPDPGALKGTTLDFYHGAVDPVFPPRITARFVNKLPDAELHLIDGHGHLLMMTYPDVWAPILTDIKAP